MSNGTNTEKEKSKFQLLQEQLSIKQRSSWLDFNENDRKKIFEFCENYKKYLNEAKTERESVEFIRHKAEQNGFKDISKFPALKKGDRFYFVNKDKTIALGVVGEDVIFNMIGAHIDSPRLDLKPRPLYEDHGLALMKTHYYGGIKKYHWFNTPLGIHGIIVDKTGKIHKLNIGENEDDPVFIISDLLPHLGRKQLDKAVKDAFEAETLNLIVGNIPLCDDPAVTNAIKLHVLSLLNEKYGITEKDLVSSEIELVPISKARDIGFDRSLVCAYGQDDSSCAYAALDAILNAKNIKRTLIAFFFDKEEIGSVGNTGADSQVVELLIELLIKKTDDKRTVNEIVCQSRVVSADVTAGVNPSFLDVHDLKNSAVVGNGVVIEKTTGYGGKYEASEAHAEFVAFITRLMDNNRIAWQACEIGKVDEGGGGTIAAYIAKYGCDIIDMGIPLLGMHSPCEVASKADIYCAYLAYLAFLDSE